jgi:FMN phosphatase YigB (HAD superfamily)
MSDTSDQQDDQQAEGPAGDAERRQAERRNVVDRRTGLDRRRGPGRRRSEDRRSAEEGEMTEEQFEFLMAINEYKRVNRRPFPSWSEVLDVMKALGYRKVAEPQDIC